MVVVVYAEGEARAVLMVEVTVVILLVGVVVVIKVLLSNRSITGLVGVMSGLAGAGD